MKSRKLPRPARRGAMLVLIAICLPLCVIMAAFAVDVAWMQLVRTELRTATDAAARAGAKELSLSQDTTAARDRAKQAARRNKVAGEPLQLADRDIQIGASTQPSATSRFNFSSGGVRPNAVRVTGRRTNGSASGPVDLLFAGVLGVREFEPQQVATSTQLDRDICLVVDRSGSMMWIMTGGSQFPPGTQPCDATSPDIEPLGCAGLRRWTRFWLSLIKRDRMKQCGLVSYSSNTNECGNTYKISTIDSDLVSDYSRHSCNTWTA